MSHPSQAPSVHRPSREPSPSRRRASIPWKLKAHALAVLSRLPGGRKLYHRLQKCLGTNRLDFEQSLARGAEIVSLVREGGREPVGETFLEIGSGWRPFLPFLLYLAGADRILTYDVNRWMDRKYVLETYSAIGGRLDRIAERLQLPVADVVDRYRRTKGRGTSLRSMLEAFRVEYHCPGDAARTGLPDRSVDCVVSSNVLEHIPETVLAAIHRESFRILRSRGLAVHRFNPQDHFSTVDSSITGANFLQFSERQWRWYGGSGLGYHNRLRCVQHRELLARTGFAIVVERVRRDDRALEALRRRKLQIDTAFERFSDEELAADYMWLVGVKGL